MTNYGKRKNLGQRKKILAKKNKKNLVPRLGAAVFDLSFLSLDPRHQSLQAHLRCFCFRIWKKKLGARGSVILKVENIVL